MVKRAQDIKHIFNEHMKGGTGTVEVIPSISTGEYKSPAKIIARLILKPGSSLGTHTHQGEEEIITVLKGTGSYNDNGITKTVSAGDVCICLEGENHSIANSSDTETLELFAVINSVL